MTTYTVVFVIRGTATMEVEADSEAEAKLIALSSDKEMVLEDWEATEIKYAEPA